MAGVKRQYMPGARAGVANGINTVHLSYVQEETHALAGAWQWIRREQIEDPVKSLVMGLPLDLEFRTKGQLAMDICADGPGLRFHLEVHGSAPGCAGSSRPRARPTCSGSPPAS